MLDNGHANQLLCRAQTQLLRATRGLRAKPVRNRRLSRQPIFQKTVREMQMNVRAIAGVGAVAAIALCFSTGVPRAQSTAATQPKPTGPAEWYFSPPGAGRGAAPAGAAAGAPANAGRGGRGARGGAPAAGAP